MLKNNVRKTKSDKVDTFVIARTLMNATHNVVKNNATFKAYYDAKRAEDGHITMPWNTVPISLSESSGKCPLKELY